MEDKDTGRTRAPSKASKSNFKDSGFRTHDRPTYSNPFVSGHCDVENSTQVFSARLFVRYSTYEEDNIKGIRTECLKSGHFGHYGPV